MAYGARAVDYPDVFKATPLSRYEPYPLVTGSAYSSHAPASWFFHPVLLPNDLAVSWINVQKSLNAAVPAGTSLASTGSEGYSYTHGVSVFQRQNYDGASTNLSAIATASFGLTASMAYSSTSQQFGLSWVTDTTGGISNLTTTSNAGNWSSYATGPMNIAIPFVSILSHGEYWFAHAHSSTTATSNSNVTLLSVSNLHIAPQFVTFGVLGGSATIGSSGLNGLGAGVASAVTTSATMAGSVISNSVANLWVQNFSAV